MNAIVKISRVVISAILILFAAYLLVGAILENHTNFHTVIKGKIYRSSEMNLKQYIYYIKKYHIKTILNLDSTHAIDNLYRNKINAASITKILHYDFQIRSTGSPNKVTIAELLTHLEDAPKPILIHCWHGADRAGFVSAIALVALENVSLHEAKKQFSWRYGVVSDSNIGSRVFRKYQNWLKATHQKHSRQSFFTWLNSK